MVVAVSLGCHFDAVFHLADEFVELLLLVEVEAVRKVDDPGMRVVAWESGEYFSGFVMVGQCICGVV